MSSSSKRPLFDLRFSLLFGLQLLILLWLGWMQMAQLSHPNAEGEDIKHYRHVASKLHSAGLTEQAAKFYEKFLRAYPSDRQAAAKMAYSIAELYEQDGELQDALAWYYQVELYDARSSVRDDASEKIVSLLERLGKHSAAKYAMSKQTALQTPDQQPPKGAVKVAKIGEKNIYLHQIHEAMDALPAQVKVGFQSKEAQVQFLKKYVADEVLHAKAIRLQYQDRKEYKKKLSSIGKQLLVQKVIEEEISKKVRLDPSDVRNYFQANQDQYSDKASVDASLIKIKSQKEAKLIAKKLEQGGSFEKLAKEKSLDKETSQKGGKLSKPIVAKTPFGGHKPEVISTILATKKGRWTAPILSNGAYYIFLVRDKRAQQVRTFEQVKDRVQYDYQMEKTQSVYQSLIEETLANEKIELYAQNLKVGP